MTFYDREDELASLETAYSSSGHAFYVVYGRRRVGKTALLKAFCADRPHLYYLAAQEAEGRQREKFVEQVADAFDERIPRIDGWDDAFEYLGEKLETENRVVVIDEFPYLVDENDSLPSYVQAFVDEQLQNTASMLVLCGSSVSTMESEVLGHESPLYGRRTGQIDLQPFSFQQAYDVIAGDIGDAIRSYSITGGTPMYLTLFDYDDSLAENIQTHILSPTAVLYNEPEFLLRTELRNPARYLSILEAVALGQTTPNEISGATGIDSGPLSKYLQTLRRLRLLEREVPVTATRKKSPSAPGTELPMNFSDSGTATSSQIARVSKKRRLSFLRGQLSQIYQHTLRQRSRIFATRLSGNSSDEVNWSRTPRSVDGGTEKTRSISSDSHPTTTGYSSPNANGPLIRLATGSLMTFEKKATNVRWGPKDRSEQFVLFSKSGFVDGLASELDERWLLVDLDDLEQVFSGPFNA